MADKPKCMTKGCKHDVRYHTRYIERDADPVKVEVKEQCYECCKKEIQSCEAQDYAKLGKTKLYKILRDVSVRVTVNSQ